MGLRLTIRGVGIALGLDFRVRVRINLKWWRVGIRARVGIKDEVRQQGLGSGLGLGIRGVGVALG